MEEEKKIRKITLSSLSSTLTTQKCARPKRKGESNIHDADSHGVFETAGSVLSHWYFFRFHVCDVSSSSALTCKKKLPFTTLRDSLGPGSTHTFTALEAPSRFFVLHLFPSLIFLRANL